MNKALYFTHDYTASTDYKILYLRAEMGWEGYGLFWYIVEQLAQSGGILPLKSIKVLSMQSGVETAKIEALIRSYGLFEVTDEHFSSKRLNQTLDKVKKLSESGRKGAAKKWADGHPNSPPISPPNGEAYANKEINKEINIISNPAYDKQFTLTECKDIALRDDRWVDRNKIVPTDLDAFNVFLEKGGIYTKHVAEYKTHYRNWRAKNPKAETTKPIKNKLDELREKYQITGK